MVTILVVLLIRDIYYTFHLYLSSYGVYISQLTCIRFARVCNHVTDFNARNKCLTAKLLQQGYRYHKLRKTFSKFYRRHYELISKYNVGLKSLLSEGLSEPEFIYPYVLRFPIYYILLHKTTAFYPGPENVTSWTWRQNRFSHFSITRLESVPRIVSGEGVKPGTNARDPGPKSGTNFYWHQKGTKHANNYMKFTPYIV